MKKLFLLLLALSLNVSCTNTLEKTFDDNTLAADLEKLVKQKNIDIVTKSDLHLYIQACKINGDIGKTATYKKSRLMNKCKSKSLT